MRYRDEYDDYEVRKSGRNRTASRKKQSTGSSSSVKSYRATKKKKNKKRKFILFAFEAVLLVVVILAVFVVTKWNKLGTITFGANEIQVNDIDPEILEKISSGYTNIAVFGIDARADSTNMESGSGADTNIIVSINNETGDVKLVSVYRDFFCEWNDEGVYGKMTGIYRNYGVTTSVNALNRNLDLNIDQVVTIDWSILANAINTLGGITIHVDGALMEEINGYIQETMNETGIESSFLDGGGTLVLDGVQAVAFSRIRKITVPGYSAGDNGRTERQREVIAAMLAKAKTVSWSTLLELIDTVFPKVYTNIKMEEAIALASKLSSYNIADTAGFPYTFTYPPETSALHDKYGAVTVCTDLVGDVSTLHQFLFGEENYTPSDQVQAIASTIQSMVQ